MVGVGVITTRIAAWWASKNASNILLMILIGWAGLHYANLKADAAACKAAQELKQQIADLADRLEKSISEETDERIEALRNADLACLDERLPDGLQDPD